jgi:hypothetical protein
MIYSRAARLEMHQGSYRALRIVIGSEASKKEGFFFCNNVGGKTCTDF